MNILLTGSSGFLGKHIHRSFTNKYTTITLNRSLADINVDLSKNTPVISTCCQLVIHAAAKAHFVPKTLTEIQEFFLVNVNGTQNLLRGLEKAPQLPSYFVFISSVSVYGVETGSLIAEDAPLLAKDPYGRSKIKAEKIVEEWCAKNNVVCTILRLPLLAGQNPPGNLGAMIKGIRKGYYFNIAEGKAKKSMVLAEDIANIIPIVSKIGGTYNLTDRYHPSFHELSDHITKQLHVRKPANIPLGMAKLIALIGDLLGNMAPINSKKLMKIISNLTFDDTKAVKIFDWKPTPVLKAFIVSK
jgi:nucleoside-diphosphate-sugar epimerase